MSYLVDHNVEGQTLLLEGIIAADGWFDLIPIQFVTFAEVGLAVNSNDRTVWQFAQSKKLILVTANRNMKGEDSLEDVIRKENLATSLPVVTISSLGRFSDRNYRERCAMRLVEIVLDIENYFGTGRIFIP